MANDFDTQIVGVAEFQKALERNPKFTVEEVKKFIQRGIAQYKSGIMNNPWRVGMSGGGSPVATGNLRDTHITSFSQLTGSIKPTATSYMSSVHRNRPWLDFVFKAKDGDMRKLENELINNLVKNLAR